MKKTTLASLVSGICMIITKLRSKDSDKQKIFTKKLQAQTCIINREKLQLNNIETPQQEQNQKPPRASIYHASFLF